MKMHTGSFPKSPKDPAQFRQMEAGRQKGFKAAGKGPGAASKGFKGAAPRTSMQEFLKGKGA